MLELADVHTYYGNIRALRGLSLSVRAGEIVTLIGANGAGKTTTLRTILGMVRPRRGTIVFDGHALHALTTDRIVRLGIGQSPEGRRIFPRMTVLENLELGAYRQLRRGKRDTFTRNLEEVCKLFPRVRERLGQPAGLLSGGEQQMVAIGRALVGGPRMLLVDEPSLGLAPIPLRSIFDAFRALKARGLTVLIVEQMAWLGLEICDRAYVIENGMIALSGTSAEVASNPRVIEAYLGAAR